MTNSNIQIRLQNPSDITRAKTPNPAPLHSTIILRIRAGRPSAVSGAPGCIVSRRRSIVTCDIRRCGQHQRALHDERSHDVLGGGWTGVELLLVPHSLRYASSISSFPRRAISWCFCSPLCSQSSIAAKSVPRKFSPAPVRTNALARYR